MPIVFILVNAFRKNAQSTRLSNRNNQQIAWEFLFGAFNSMNAWLTTFAQGILQRITLESHSGELAILNPSGMRIHQRFDVNILHTHFLDLIVLSRHLARSTTIHNSYISFSPNQTQSSPGTRTSTIDSGKTTTYDDHVLPLHGTFFDVSHVVVMHKTQPRHRMAIFRQTWQFQIRSVYRSYGYKNRIVFIDDSLHHFCIDWSV